MTLDELRAKIPSFECIEGCADCCCYHCTMSESELIRMRERYQNIDVKAPDYICDNVQVWEYCMFVKPDASCAVYEQRPMRCRLFGVTKDKGSQYACPHGCGPDEPWTEEQLLAWMREYEKLTAGQPEYITFGLVDGQIKPITRGEDGQCDRG